MTESLAAQLLDHILAGGGSPTRVSVVGLCKNAGKTVTLNHIIRAAAGRRLPLGLVSTGRDGEEQDAVTELPKPRIWAPAGAWVATAAQALAAGTARIDIFQELPMTTRFGPIVIGRVATEGELLLIGPGSTRRISEVLGGLEAYGASLCLVDGSFDRIAAAAPTVTGRVVLAAGAAYSQSMSETVSQVRHVLDVFDLPQVPAAITPAIARALLTGPVSMVSLDGTVTAIPVASGLGDPEPIVAAGLEQEPGSAYLVLGGALGDRLLMTMLKRRLQLAGVVVTDPTHVLVERNLWRRWRRQGGLAFVRRKVALVAVTANAYSPVGRGYDAHEFLTALTATANRPVFDLEAGLTQPPQ